jgi:putative tryptophan/tyrosine transport system substrate-binding protein
MRRRDFIKGFAGSAIDWPLVARAQQTDRVRRIGVLMSITKDSNSLARVAAFRQQLQVLGWTDGRNVQIDDRWSVSDPERIRKDAAQLVASEPDAILANGSAPVWALQRATRTVPVVFVAVVDPVGEGFVASLAEPGGNITGFTQFDYSMSGKWLELIKQITPSVTRVAVIRDPSAPAGTGQFGAIQAVAPSLNVEVRPLDIRDTDQMERTIASFARQPNSGLITTAGPLSTDRRQLIISLAARYRLPAIYPNRYYATEGGLISYGTDIIDQYKRAADDVDRILRGEKVADLPVQQPTKFEIVINLKTAKTLGLTISPSLLAAADEVIE